MTAVNYLWNPLNDNIVEEFDDAGGTVTEYTTEPSHFGNVISQNLAGQESFLHFDGVGSILAVTDSTGTVTDTRSYSAFGETTEQLGSTVLPLQFVGQAGYYRDAESGEYDIRRRPYAMTRGRWLSNDPARAHFDTSIYIYSSNRPVSLTDPAGLLPRIPRPCPVLPGAAITVGYGNYCGLLKKATCLGVGKPAIQVPAPIDALDDACVQHDCCLMGWYFCNPVSQYFCNIDFCEAVKAVDCSLAPVPSKCLFTKTEILVACVCWNLVSVPPVIFIQ